MRPKRFRKKPVEIEAMQLDANNAAEVALWCGGALWEDPMFFPEAHRSTHVVIHTLEGTMHATPGDWVIKGIQGEFYPCKPDIFAATYDEVSG